MSSLQDGKQEAVMWIKSTFQQGDTCLDVGACDGKWFDLLGDYLIMDAVEIFKPYINRHKLKEKYRKVFNENICIFKYAYYDLIILGDVLEHMSVQAARNVIEYAKPRCRDMVIAVPFEWEQGAINKNPWEVHIQNDLTPELFNERYPGFKPLFQIDNYAYYILEQHPTISVIIPYYNSEPWLERCCRSLTQQHGSELTFVFVDDSSTDNSAKIVSEFAKKDDRFRLHSNSGCKGVSGARNTGLNIALNEVRSDWITFLDADDELTEDAYIMFQKYVKQHDHGIIQFEHYRYYAEQNKTVVSRRYANEEKVYNVSTGLPKLFCMVWNKLYRADLLRGIYFEEGMQYGEDEIFNLECLCNDPEIVVDNQYPTTIHHFENSNSLCHRKAEVELLEQAKRLSEFLVRHQDPIIRRAVCWLLSEHWGSATYLEGLCKDGKV